MIFYELELLGTPKINFACSVNKEKNKNSFHNIKDFIEICIIEEGISHHRYPDGKQELICPGMLSAIFSDTNCEIYGEGRQRHTTVGVIVPYNLTRYNSEEECDIHALKDRMRKNVLILIPYQYPIDDICEKLIGMIKNISQLHLSTTPSDKIKAIGAWYSLTALLTDFVLKKLDKTNNFIPSEQLYAEKAIKYISCNYQKKLSIAEIAEQLELSTGHLHRIFKNVIGMSPIEYLNHIRVKAAISLMQNQKLSLHEASVNVGIDDPAYMSRLFRKVTGLSCREYMSLEKKS
ncbi:MAG: helix-turn-helix transcriptional regulator [Ruminococcaceae bacterium]|nr:helix-turn-helix transcriptional regulator [Oscillospiraceae bacterium]